MHKSPFLPTDVNFFTCVYKDTGTDLDAYMFGSISTIKGFRPSKQQALCFQKR